MLLPGICHRGIGPEAGELTGTKSVILEPIVEFLRWISPPWGLRGFDVVEDCPPALWTAYIAVHPRDELVLHDGARNPPSIGFDED